MLFPQTGFFKICYTDPKCKIPVTLCLHALKDLFFAGGEGIEKEYLDNASKPLEHILAVYDNDTKSLIRLYESAPDIQEYIYLLLASRNNDQEAKTFIKNWKV